MQKRMAEQDYSINVILTFLFTIILTGMNGLIAFILLALMAKFDVGRDSKKKHGLSTGTSRLGGIAIVLSIFFGCIFNQIYLKEFRIEFFLLQTNSLLILSLIIGLIGLVEDLNQNLSSIKRLLLIVFFVSVSLIASPELLPLDLGIYEFFGMNDAEIFIYIFTITMVSGFINAGNIADGANGLLAIIFLGFFVVAYNMDSTILNFSILISLIAFIIFNVSSGKIFLGDFGAYFLSSLVAFKSLEMYSNNKISVFFLASILVYPCFEISRTLMVRASKKLSLMTPDNNHLHNHFNAIMINYGLSKHLANSFTGVSIAFCTSVAPIYLYFEGISINSDIWRILFLSQIIALSIIYIVFKKKLSR